MKTISTILIPIMALALLVTGCKKDDDDDKTPTVNVLCDGIDITQSSTVNKFYPMKDGYKWELDGGSMGSETHFIDSVRVIDGNSYFGIKFSGSAFGFSHYRFLRVENGNVYRMFNAGFEEIEIKADPQVGDQWPHFTGYYKKVLSVTATVSTSSCDYTNALKIGEYLDNGSLITTDYYVEGIGIVRTNSFSNTDLTSVILD